MGRKYHVYQIDAFTQTKLLGNPAGVITNADGLSGVEMQMIARELNNSETAFIFSSNKEEYDVHIRYFTPKNEVPICGHATIAAHYARALERHLESCCVFQKTGVGVLPVDIFKEVDDYKIVMTQGAITFGSNIEGEILQSLLEALHITAIDLLKNVPVQIVSTGYGKVMIGIKDKRILDALTPDMIALSKISSRIDCNGFYVFTFNEGEPSNVLVYGRMFAPAVGVNEDPVTGNANGPLGAYLVKHKLVKHDNRLLIFNAIQGETINRLGLIQVMVSITDNEPSEVKIAGHAVVVFKTEIEL